MRWIFLTAIAILSLAFVGASAQTPRRVALVIANSNYIAGGNLSTPANDARLISQALSRAGFNVVVRSNLDANALRSAIRSFRSSSEGAQVALVYYSGHGIQVNGENWLIPVDARLSSEANLPAEAVAVQTVVQSASGAAQTVILLDASRNNQFGLAWRSLTKGLASVEADNTLIMVSAAPGQVASDGNGPNSPFAAALARRLPESGLPLQLLGARVRDDVLQATGGQQRPVVSASLTGEPFYLVSKPPTAAAPAITEEARKEAERARLETERLAAELSVARNMAEQGKQAAAERERQAAELRTDDYRLERLRFNKPQSMKINRPYVVEAQIGMREIQSLGDVGPTVSRDVEVPQQGGVRVELISDQLKVEKLHAVDTLVLAPGKTGLWSWRVTPHQEGREQRMLLQVYASNPADASGEVLVETYRETVLVDVTPLDRAELYGRAFLKRWEIVAGVGAALAALGGFVSFLLGRRRKPART